MTRTTQCEAFREQPLKATIQVRAVSWAGHTFDLSWYRFSRCLHRYGQHVVHVGPTGVLVAASTPLIWPRSLPITAAGARHLRTIALPAAAGTAACSTAGQLPPAGELRVQYRGRVAKYCLTPTRPRKRHRPGARRRIRAAAVPVLPQPLRRRMLSDRSTSPAPGRVTFTQHPYMAAASVFPPARKYRTDPMSF